MALTPEQIDAAYRVVWTTVPHRNRLSAFARAIEAEVRKQDDALILMLVERLERADKISGHANNKAAIKAGRAWLEGTQ